MQFSTLQQYITVQRSAVQQYITVQCSAVQCKVVKINRVDRMNAGPSPWLETPSAVQCNDVHCGLQCTALQCTALQCTALQCTALEYSWVLIYVSMSTVQDVTALTTLGPHYTGVMQFELVQCSTMQCSVVQCSAVQYRVLHSLQCEEHLTISSVGKTTIWGNKNWNEINI